MNKEKYTRPVGILNQVNFLKHCSLTRYYPCEKLQPYIEHYWHITWQLTDDFQYQQSVIPHPNTHLVFLSNKSHIQGVCQKKYSHTLVGQGSLIGVKFSSAGFYTFAKRASLTMSQLCNTVINIDDVFNIDVKAVEKHILALTSPLEKVGFIDSTLFSSINESIIIDNNVLLLNRIVAEIESNKALLTVENVAEHFALSQRQLQRLFKKYIGIGVKWVISRYRIHDALTKIDHIETTTKFNWADLSVKLGYYDQAHFIHTFSQLVGKTPNEYQRSLA